MLASTVLHRIDRAQDLPEGWDQLTASYFQTTSFLRHAERYNPCRQRYYVLTRDSRPVAGASVYTLRLDLFTFARIPSPVRIHFIGVPCSCSVPGLLGAEEPAGELIARLQEVERGLVVGLNLDQPIPGQGLVYGQTLPSVWLDLGFSSWSAYRGALRSSYRRRLDRVLASWEGVYSERSLCDQMSPAMYGQYLDVWRKSKAKLERLSLEFFHNLPEPFHLTVHRQADRVLGWHIVLTEGAHKTFFLAGVDYPSLHQGQNYLNLLASVVREAVEDGAQSIDLGQTAEVPKTRLGGRLARKSIFGWSSSPLLRWMLGRGKGLLEYRVAVPQAHVFRAGSHSAEGGAQ